MKIHQSVRHPIGTVFEKFLFKRGRENVGISERRHIRHGDGDRGRQLHLGKSLDREFNHRFSIPDLRVPEGGNQLAGADVCVKKTTMGSGLHQIRVERMRNPKVLVDSFTGELHLQRFYGRIVSYGFNIGRFDWGPVHHL